MWPKDRLEGIICTWSEALVPCDVDQNGILVDDEHLGWN